MANERGTFPLLLPVCLLHIVSHLLAAHGADNGVSASKYAAKTWERLDVSYLMKNRGLIIFLTAAIMMSGTVRPLTSRYLPNLT